MRPRIAFTALTLATPNAQVEIEHRFRKATRGRVRAPKAPRNLAPQPGLRSRTFCQNREGW